MKFLNNKKQEKQPCGTCIHWNKIYTGLPIIIGEKDAGYPLQLEELVLLHCKKGQTQKITGGDDGYHLQPVEFYCKIGNTKTKNIECKNFKKDPNVEVKEF